MSTEDKTDRDQMDWNDATIKSENNISPTRRKSERPPFVLKQTAGPGAPKGFVLGEERVILGRAVEADIQIDSKEVSRRHLLLRKEGPEYSCTDLKSSNGVYLNGIKIHSATLKDGDTIQIGNVTLVYRIGA
jgi:pSer/pThr/pTyr-binding forkhead associated (FHA) protein